MHGSGRKSHLQNVAAAISAMSLMDAAAAALKVLDTIIAIQCGAAVL